MKRDISIKANGEAVFAGIKVIDHIAVTRLDLWADEDGNGRPDKFIRTLKEPNTSENKLVKLGLPAALKGKVLQFVWHPSQPPNSVEGWVVQLRVKQGTKLLDGFPIKIGGQYPAGETHGIFQTWLRFV